MSGFERSAIGVVGVLTAGLFTVTLMHPVAGVTASPEAVIAAETSISRLVVAVKSRMAPVPVNFTLPSGDKLDAVNGKELPDTLAHLGYDLDSIIEGNGRVPRLFLASLPPGIEKIRETKVRKAVFFKTVLPLILQVNEEVLVDRRRLWDLKVRLSLGERWGAADRLWLVVMAERYGTERGDMDALLNRVDVISPSMALAQAATESGWGTSRFVREGNAIFGQRTFTEATDGLTPDRRDEGKTHRVRAFASLLDSVRSYVRNLNTHRAYGTFRQIRTSLRDKGVPLDGVVLAAGLVEYSERGAGYVNYIRAMISANNLRRLDDARLREEDTAPQADI